MKERIMFLILVLMFCLPAQAVLITAAFTGAWYDEEVPGQGYLIQILEQDGESVAMVFWFSYDLDGNPQWLNGLAPIDGDSVTVELLHSSGGQMLPGNSFTNNEVSTVAWGTLTLSFQNCNRGTAVFNALDPAYGSGTHIIKRLSKTRGSECSGGISDNNPPSTPETDVQYNFTNTGEDDDASGRLKLEENSQLTKLKIWYKDLDAGNYDLLVDGETVATLVARANGQSHQFFSSPQLADWLLLDFEVHGKTIEIAQDGVVYLTVTLP